MTDARAERRAALVQACGLWALGGLLGGVIFLPTVLGADATSSEPVLTLAAMACVVSAIMFAVVATTGHTRSFIATVWLPVAACAWISAVGVRDGSNAICWSLGLFVAISIAFVGWRSEVRTDPLPGRCATCDYDMAGLGNTQCPECGTAKPIALPSSRPGWAGYGGAFSALAHAVLVVVGVYVAFRVAGFF